MNLFVRMHLENCTHTHTHTHTQIDKLTQIHTRIHTYTHTNTHTHKNTHTNTCTHTHTHTRTHTHTPNTYFYMQKHFNRSEIFTNGLLEKYIHRLKSEIKRDHNNLSTTYILYAWGYAHVYMCKHTHIHKKIPIGI